MTSPATSGACGCAGGAAARSVSQPQGGCGTTAAGRVVSVHTRPGGRLSGLRPRRRMPSRLPSRPPMLHRKRRHRIRHLPELRARPRHCGRTRPDGGGRGDRRSNTDRRTALGMKGRVRPLGGLAAASARRAPQTGSADRVAGTARPAPGQPVLTTAEAAGRPHSEAQVDRTTELRNLYCMRQSDPHDAEYDTGPAPGRGRKVPHRPRQATDRTPLPAGGTGRRVAPADPCGSGCRTPNPTDHRADSSGPEHNSGLDPGRVMPQPPETQQPGVPERWPGLCVSALGP